MMESDISLVKEFAATGSETAFGELVSRYINLVFSVALRQTRDHHLAEEVTQAVFIILARKGHGLNEKTVLAGWLCRAARNVAANALTVQHRRQQREQQAYMQSHLNETEPNAWTQVEPLLEQALSELSDKDHSAIVLRFFEGRSLKDASAALASTEAGTKMRVNRALEKLRRFFLKHGVVMSATTIAGAISANSVQSAPMGFAGTVTAAAVKGSGVTISTATLIKTTLKTMTYSKLKIAGIGIVSAVCLAGGSAVLVERARAGGEAKTNATALGKTTTGFESPEVGLKTYFKLMATGDLEKTLAACTTEEADRVRKKVANMEPDKVQQQMIEDAKTRGNYKLTDSEEISDTEIRLHLEVPPFPGHEHIGYDVQVMQKVGNDWRYAGKYGVDIKED